MRAANRSGAGIGRAITVVLAGQGASVVVAARSANQLDECVNTIKQASGEATAVVADVTDPHAVVEMMDRAEQTYGPIDLLVNNAASNVTTGPLWETDPDAELVVSLASGAYDQLSGWCISVGDDRTALMRRRAQGDTPARTLQMAR
jgi:NAD(P)-dependent dehydrogenase (short-subunit alcohol dehydrogenase family)